MMKKGLYAMFATLCMVSTVHAYTGFGICNFGTESVPAVICYGPAVLKGTTVAGDLKVAGPLTAENVSAGSLTITGAIDMQNSKVTGAVEVTGNLNANNVDFGKDLHLTSDNVVLHHARVKGSVLINSSSGTPYLVMECGTVIKGDVKFIGKAGIVQITDDSIMQGKLKNGSMEFIKKTCQ
jgi:hypothetical protein